MIQRLKEAKTFIVHKWEDIARRNAEEGLPPLPFQNSPKVNDSNNAGWISPIYSQSRSIHLDPGVIARNRCLAYMDNMPAAEAYRVLRAQILQRTRGTGSNVIMVTSALPAEGKTLSAINLALTFSREFRHTVLLVDADLRRQSVHEYLGCSGEKGLIDYLADGTPLQELITWPGIEKMTLISGGRLYHESSEMLGSPRMKELISDMKGRYPDRYIIIDAPPVLTGADVLTLAPLVDQVVVVVHAGVTSLEDVKQAVQYLPREKILGFVLNRSSTDHADYYSEYYYGKRKQQ
jgi:protein-tyrosine kinase